MRLRSMKRGNTAVADEEEEEEWPQQVEVQQQPRNLTKNVRGDIRKYNFLKTVKTFKELDKLRFKNFCKYSGSTRERRIASKSFTMRCATKKLGKVCDFQLKAVRPNLSSGTIHVYGRSQHNHPIMSEKKRAISKHVKELMPDANPPMIFRTVDNLEWQFLGTFPDYGKMQKFRHKHQSRSETNANETWCRIRIFCKRKYYKNNNCKFMLLAMKTTNNGYHVYKHGEHNQHPIVKPYKKVKALNIQKEMENEEEQEEEEEKAEESEHSEDEDEKEEESEEEEEKELREEEEDQEEDKVEEDEDEDEEDDQEKERKPVRKMAKTLVVQKKKYHFLKTVKSMEELDKCRFKNNCIFSKTPSQINKPTLMPCSTRRSWKGCNFELNAVPSDLKKGHIDVYAFSRHNHPFESEERRSMRISEKNLMPDANPPMIFRTSDNIDWKFLQTFPDYGKMQKFICNKWCRPHGDEKRWRIRHYCYRRSTTEHCPFMLLALKTTNNGYHVYKHGEHNKHPVIVPKKSQPSARSHQKQQRNKDEEEEKEMEEKEALEKDEMKYMEEEDDQEDEANEWKEGAEEVGKVKGKEEEEEEKGTEEDEIEYMEMEEEDDAIEQEEREGENEDEDEKGGEKEEDEDEDEDEVLFVEFVKKEGDDEAEDDDIQVIEIEHEQQREQQQEEREGSMEIEIIENPQLLEDAQPAAAVGEANPQKEETLEDRLKRANAKVYKWMAGIAPYEIGPTIKEWDKWSVLKMVEMADQEIREHPQKLNLWLPWLKCAVMKCLIQIDGFDVRFENLINLVGI